MANKVTVQVTGAAPKVLDNVLTVADVKKQLGLESYQATVNGDAAGNDVYLDDYSFVTLAPAVKGA